MADERHGGERAGPTDEELREAIPRASGGHEVRVGIFVVVGVLAVLLSLFLLTDPATLRGRYMLVTQVDDAGGIRAGDPVQMRGVNVGRIHGFEMTPTGRVDITLEVEGEWEVPEDSYTRLAGAGLFGGRTMQIIRGNAQAMAEPWDTIEGHGEEGGVIESAEALSNRAEQVLSRIHLMLDDSTVTSVQGTAADVRNLVSELRGLARVQRVQLSELTETLNRSARGLEAASAAGPDAARAVSRADSALVTLNRTAATLDRTVESLTVILDRMEAGEGTLGRLSTDEALYDELTAAARSIRALSEDIQANPRRYFNLEIF